MRRRRQERPFIEEGGFYCHAFRKARRAKEDIGIYIFGHVIGLTKRIKGGLCRDGRGHVMFSTEKHGGTDAFRVFRLQVLEEKSRKAIDLPLTRRIRDDVGMRRRKVYIATNIASRIVFGSN